MAAGPMTADRAPASAERIEGVILALAAARGPAKTICPSEAARAIAGDRPEQWSRLMGPIRQVAVRLMKEGRIVIRRKGRPVDPDDFKGVYRISLAEPGGEGNSSVERPDSR